MTPKAIKAMEAYRQTKELPLRTFYLDLMASSENNVSQIQRDTQDALLSEYGYQIQENDCFIIDWNNSRTSSSPARAAAWFSRRYSSASARR